MAHWHDFNPWATTLIYLPNTEEVYEALIGDSESKRNQIQRYSKYKRADLYVLPKGSIGLRFGKEPGDYISLFVLEGTGVKLYNKYKGEAL